MLIANPVYDTVFKYFLDDNTLAKQFIGLLLDITILEMEIQPQEVPLKITNPEDEERPISFMRMDFKATVKDEKGNRKVVLIELQKSKNAADLFRFRNYLGAQYLNRDNSYTENEEEFPIPIISIYFIGFSLPFYPTVPLIKVERNYMDVCTKEILPGKIPFIETLSHDMILVQLPAIKRRRRFEIEKILSIFDSRAGIYMEIDENDYPIAYRVFLERLSTVMKEPEVVRDLMYEEMLNKEIQRDHRNYLKSQEELKEALAIAKREENQKKVAITNLKNRGMSISEIASIFTISEEQVKEILSEE